MLKSVSGITVAPGVMLIVSVETNDNGYYFTRVTDPRRKLNMILHGPKARYEESLDEAKYFIARSRKYYSEQ